MKGVPLDTATAHPARRYNYLLGGKDNFAADRQSADELVAAFPGIKTAAVENRRYLNRVVRHLAVEAGIRQFLDIGTGIPTAPNVHEIVEAVDADSAVVYVDNDPLVITHARALLTGIRPDSIGYIHADLRRPESILESPVLRQSLDLNQPVALLLVAILHFIRDDEHPYDAVRTLLNALPSGSYLALSHVTFDPLPGNVLERLTALPAARHGDFQPRRRAEIAQFADGLHILDPGVVSIVEWRPDAEPKPEASPDVAMSDAVVARLP